MGYSAFGPRPDRVQRAGPTAGRTHMDIVSREKRSRMMSGIRGKDTRPELLVRSTAHRLGLRFRLHVKELPGRPDLVFPRYRTALFVHGCFWHRHDCALAAVPSTRSDFWLAKFAANVERDRRSKAALESQGWRVLEIWECETRRPELVEKRLRAHFGLNLSALRRQHELPPNDRKK